MSESEAVYVDEDPQNQQTDIIVPAKWTINQQEGEGAKGTNNEQEIQWMAIQQGEANDELISIPIKLCELFETPDSDLKVSNETSKVNNAL